MIKHYACDSFRKVFPLVYPKESPLVYCVAHGYTNFLSHIIIPSEIKTVKDEHGKSLVKVAFENNQFETALFLLNKGAPCDFSDIRTLSMKQPLEKFIFLKYRSDWLNLTEGNESFTSFVLKEPFNPVLFKFAVKCGLDPNQKDPNTDISPLCTIIKESNVEALKILIKNGFRGDYEDSEKLINIFAHEKNTEMLNVLLSNGFTQEDVPGELSTLQLAVASRPSALQTYKENEEIVLRDMRYIININVFERNFKAALLLLAQKKQITVDYILEAANNYDIPALFFYIMCSNFSSSEINEIRTKLPLNDSFPNQMIEFFFHDGNGRPTLTKMDNLVFDDCGLLNIAAKYSSKDLFERLVRKRLDIDAIDNDGNRPLDIAISACRFDIVYALIMADVSCNTINPDYPTIFHLLASNPRLKYYMMTATNEEITNIKAFIVYSQDQGQSLTTMDDNGLTPLLIAAMDGNYKLCEIFVSLGAINDNIDNNLTFLHILLNACKENHKHPFVAKMYQFRHSTTDPRPQVNEIYKLTSSVLKFASNINSFTGDNILHLCTKLRLPILCEHIMHREDLEACKNAHNANGDTALHIAARLGDLQIVQLLVNNGCNINAVNSLYQTPFMVSLMDKDNITSMYFLLLGSAIRTYDVNKLTPLHYASKSGNFPVAMKLIESGAPINFVDVYGRNSAYYAAAKANVIEFVEYIKAHANIFSTDYKGRTPLHSACKAGNSEIVNYLISSYPPGFADDDRMTPLHIACKYGNTNCIECYASKPEGLNLKDYRGDTPMHTAVRNDNVACVETLVKIGANPSVINFDGQTPIVLAAAKKSKKCLEFFFRIGQKLTPKDGFLALREVLLQGDFEFATELINYGVSVKSHHWGRCLLTLAVVKNRIDIIKFLCVNRVMESLSEMDLTPFAYAYLFDNKEALNVMLKEYPSKRLIDIIDMFSPDLAKKKEELPNMSPKEVEALKKDVLYNPSSFLPSELRPKSADIIRTLVNAIFEGKADIVKTILEYGINPNKTSKGQTLLYIAVKKNKPDIVELLLKHGADPNRINKSNRKYPLLIAVTLNRINLFKILVENGARLDILNDKEETILHRAIIENRNQFIKPLFQYGANINAVEKAGKTPLFIAAEMGNKESVELLLDSGARRDLKSNDGKSIYETPLANKSNQIVHILESSKI